ncbi:MAG: ABC transporter ATP-binding protein [Peptococcia bacterium]
MLTIKDLHVYYGVSHALRGINFNVKKGEIVTILGSNGAGKTTTLRTISGLIKPKKGSIDFEGNKISEMPADQIVRLGISHVPEGRRIFPKMTVLENLEMGAYSLGKNVDIKPDLEKIYTMFPRLKERLKQRAGTFSGGEQQMLAIARALMNRPKVLLMDEPSMGIAPLVVEEIFRTIVKLNKEQGMTILLVEQNAQMALSIAHRAYVIENGSVVLEGDAVSMKNNPEVKKAYLGIE